MTKYKNFSGQTTPDIVDDVYEQCNFSQPAPADDGGTKKGVRLFPGDDTPRTFIDCNLVNCEPPPGSTVTGGNTTIKDLDVVIDSDTVTIDGESVTLNNIGSIVYGHFNKETQQYDYLDTPEVTVNRRGT